MAKSLTLKEWIYQVGTKEAAKLLRVDPSAVRHWARGHCLPRDEQKRLIRKYSKGAVTYEEIIERTLKTSKTSARV